MFKEQLFFAVTIEKAFPHSFSASSSAETEWRKPLLLLSPKLFAEQPMFEEHSLEKSLTPYFSASYPKYSRHPCAGRDPP
jgi:hypothetical protein